MGSYYEKQKIHNSEAESVLNEQMLFHYFTASLNDFKSVGILWFRKQSIIQKRYGRISFATKKSISWNRIESVFNL